jgi:hypothetical protein
VEALQPGLARQRDEAATLLDQLASRATERAAALEREQLALHELEGRLVIRAQLPGLRDHVRTAQWALRAEQLVGRIPAVARSLTVVSKRASEQLLNADFERRFETERAALRGPPVQLEFPPVARGRPPAAKASPLATASPMFSPRGNRK